MSICSVCRSQNMESAKFCGNCGNPFPRVAETSSSLHRCEFGHLYSVSYQTCPYCPANEAPRVSENFETRLEAIPSFVLDAPPPFVPGSAKAESSSTEYATMIEMPAFASSKLPSSATDAVTGAINAATGPADFPTRLETPVPLDFATRIEEIPSFATASDATDGPGQTSNDNAVTGNTLASRPTSATPIGITRIEPSPFAVGEGTAVQNSNGVTANAEGATSAGRPLPATELLSESISLPVMPAPANQSRPPVPPPIPVPPAAERVAPPSFGGASGTSASQGVASGRSHAGSRSGTGDLSAHPALSGANRSTSIMPADDVRRALSAKGKLVGWLVSYSLNPDGEDYRLRAGYNRLGANPACDIVLEDETVSGSHSIIVYRDGRCLIKDDLSRNGTYVNGKEVTEAHPLQNYDQIRLGNTILIYVAAQKP